MKTVLIKSNREGDIWFQCQLTGRVECLKTAVHTKVSEEDYYFLRSRFGQDIEFIKDLSAPVQQSLIEKVSVVKKTVRKKK